MAKSKSSVRKIQSPCVWQGRGQGVETGRGVGAGVGAGYCLSPLSLETLCDEHPKCTVKYHYIHWKEHIQTTSAFQVTL